MIHILYLAAGQSRRYGSNKLLTERDGKPLYRHGLDAMLEAIRERNDCTLTVVTCWPEIHRQLAEEGIRTVDCPDSHLGVSYTIRAGIRSLGSLAEDDYLLFAAADQPNLRGETIGRLLDMAERHPLTACLSCHGESGNPVLFSASLAEELCALEGDRGGKAVMRRHPENHLDVPCDPAELEDIDVKNE